MDLQDPPSGPLYPLVQIWPKTLRKYPLTTAALGLLAITLFAASVTHVDLISIDLERLGHIRPSEMDEVLVLVVFLIFGIAADRRRRAVARERAAEAAKLRVLHATMRTVQDIVNNLLNGLHLLRLEPEDMSREEVDRMLDELIADATARIKALGMVTEAKERPMAVGLGIAYELPTEKGGEPSEPPG